MQQRMPKPNDPRGECGFVGLNNQGATCYLNALIQVMFMTPEFRSGLFSVDPLELGSDLVREDQEQHHKKTTSGIIEADDQLVEMMVNMGFEDKRVRCALVTAKNDMERAFEIIDTISEKELQKYISQQQQATSTRKKPRYIPLELQRLFTELQCYDQISISTEDLTSKGFQWQGADGRVQHDVHELNRLFLEAVEKSLKNTSAQRMCQDLYSGSLVNQVLCLECLHMSERRETFSDLNLQVANCQDFVTAVDQYCGKEVLSGESAYQCDKCMRRTIASRATVIEKLPEYLTISCNRFKIDRSTNWQRVKVTTKCDYPLVMNLQKVMQSYDLKNVLQDPSLLPSSLDNVAEWVGSGGEDLQSIRHDMFWISNMIERSEAFVREKIMNYLSLHHINSKDLSLPLLQKVFQLSEHDCAEFRKQIQMEDMISSEGCNYILHSVIVHQGSAYSGHYYAYIRDNQREGNKEVFQSSSFLDQLKKRQNDNLDGHRKINQHVLYYLMDSDTNGSSRSSNGTIECWISDANALGQVLSVYANIEKKHVYRNAPTKGKKKNDRNHSKDTSVFSVSVDQLCREFPDCIGGSWDKLYRKEYGRLDDFLKLHEVIFLPMESQQDKSKSGVRYAVNPSLVLKLVSHDEFLRKIASCDAVHANHQNTQQSSISSSPNEPNISALDTSPELSLFVKEQSEGLLRKIFGSYFEFNDHKISPLSFATIDESFEGVNSAYLLVYKRLHKDHSIDRVPVSKNKDVEVLSREKNKGGKAHATISPKKVQPEAVVQQFDLSDRSANRPKPPKMWRDIVEARNKELMKERELYKELTSRVKIGIVTESCFDYQLPLLKWKKNDCDVEKRNQEGSLSEIDNVPERMVPFECSSTLTLRAVLLEIAASTELQKQLSFPHKFDEETANLWNVSLLDLYGTTPSTTGYYPRNVLDHTMIVGDVLQSGNMVLLWHKESTFVNENSSNSRSSITAVSSSFIENLLYCDSLMCYGEECRPHPLKIRVYTLSSMIQSMAFHATPNVVKKRSSSCFNSVEEHVHTVYVPSNFLLMDGLMLVAQQMKINFFQSLQVHIRIPIFQDASTLLRTSESDNIIIDEKELKNASKVYLLLESGKLLLRSIPNGPPIEEKKTKLKEMWYLQELLLEDSDQRGLHVTSLMERYDKFVANAIELKFVFDEKLIHKLQSLGFEFKVDSAALKSELTIQVSKNSTVMELKEELLLLLGDVTLALLTDVRLRTGSKRGEGQLEEDDEKAGVGNAKSNKKKPPATTLFHLEFQAQQVIYLDYFEPDSQDHSIDVTVQFKGKSNEYLPLELGRIQINCLPSISIKEFRDVVGQKFLNFPCGWTQHEQNIDELKLFSLGSDVKEMVAEIADSSIHECTEVRSPFLQWLDGYEGWRLRGSTWMGEPGTLLEEVNNAGEANTLHSLDLQSGDILFFESGPVPLANTIILKIYGWKTEDLTNGKEDTPNIALSHSDHHETRKDGAILRIDEIYKNRLHHLHVIGELSLAISMDINAVYESVAQFVVQENIGTFIMRELRADFLPGRTMLPDSSSNQNNRPSLKKIGWKTGSGIVLQTVSSIPIGVSDRSFKVWLHRLNNPQNAAKGNAQMFPVWPPHEIVVHGGICPMMGHLVRPILDIFTDISKSDLCILRYNPITAQWCVLDCGILENGSKKTSKNTKSSNICNAPYNLRDGDVIAVFSLKDLKLSLSQALRDSKPGTLTNTFEHLEWDVSTLEDVELRKLREFESSKKSHGSDKKKSAKPSSNTKTNQTGKDKDNKSRRSVEKALVINMDDFDD